ncbi:hypothetical protein UlMin_013819 [Ulmus minor]
MGILKLFQLYTCVVVLALIVQKAESMVLIRFDQTPPAWSRYSNATFRYSFQMLNGSNACQDNRCFIHCQLDGQALSSCLPNNVVLKNIAVNGEHKFVLNVTTWNGGRNSSIYSWYIDSIPPTATITSQQNYTNAKRIAIDVLFSEACMGRGGFKCTNSSNCDVIVKGPAQVLTTSIRSIKSNIHYKFDIIFSMTSTFGRVVISLADNICTDQAGNRFVRTNGSSIIIHYDRRPVTVDLWTSVTAYELAINGVPRTVLATNKMEELKIYLDFSIPIMNSTEQVMNSLLLNWGNLMPIDSRNQGNRRFAFKVEDISRTRIITVELQAHLIFGRTGTPVSPVPSITFLFDSQEPSVRLSTNSPNVTKEFNINVIAEFTKPVFGFETSMVEVSGGKITRFTELSRALYSMTVEAVSRDVISVAIPSGKTLDISGNLNLASNQLEVRHYSTPSISVALHSFVTAGILATSLATAVLSLSFANLGAIDTLASGSTCIISSDPLNNLHGMIGHLQVFVLSDWLLVNQPIEYSETTKGLRWLIPHQKLPWKKDNALVWPNHIYLADEKLVSKYSTKIANNQTSPCLPNTSCRQPKGIEVMPGWLHGQHNISMKNAPYGQALDHNEYFTYFLRGEPLSASDVAKRMENYKGWRDLEMNLFWLSVGGGGLVLTHVMLFLFLRWRTGTPVLGTLSFPRFELFLLILMLPCISQSSAFIIRGGTIGGVIAGALLLAIPAAFIFSVCLFLIVAIFSGSLAQYKEVKHVGIEEPWYTKLWFFFTMRSIARKWFYREGLPSSFFSRFGILFESQRGPPMLVFVDQNDSNTIPKWTESSHIGIGKMRALSSDDSNEETEIPFSRRLLGCARSSYIIVDLSRRVCLGIISGVYSSKKPSQSMFALIITILQFTYLLAFKPYISRRVHLVESISLLCEVGLFCLSFSMRSKNPMEAQTLGFVMLALLFVTFVAQLINEWYALINSLLRLSHPRKNSLKLGLKFAAKGLVLPFLSRKQWSGVTAPTSHPKTGLAPVNTLSTETELKGRDRIAPSSAMTATVVPVLSPGSPGPNVIQTSSSQTAERNLSRQRIAEGKQLKEQEIESRSELKKLRALARASFSGDSKDKEASTSYNYRP